MNKKSYKLAQELISCDDFSWKPGMLASSEDKDYSRVSLDLKNEAYLPLGPAEWSSFCVPNVEDPATKGIILQMLRDALGNQDVYIANSKNISGITMWHVSNPSFMEKSLYFSSYETEIEAIIFALKDYREDFELIKKIENGDATNEFLRESKRNLIRRKMSRKFLTKEDAGVSSGRPPSYDEEFFEGLEWLNEQ